MPHALELPWMLCAIVELMGGERFASLGRHIVGELVAFALGHASWSFGFALGRSGLEPALAAIVGALDDLSKPSTGLRGVDAIGVSGRSLEMVEFPSREVRTADFPLVALAIGGKDECSLACSNEDSKFAHDSAP